MYTKQAQVDAKRLSQSGVKDRALELLRILEEAPYRTPPRYEPPVGNLKGALSRRTNIQHRLVCQVLEEERVVKVLRMWTRHVGHTSP